MTATAFTQSLMYPLAEAGVHVYPEPQILHKGLPIAHGARGCRRHSDGDTDITGIQEGLC